MAEEQIALHLMHRRFFIKIAERKTIQRVHFKQGLTLKVLFKSYRFLQWLNALKMYFLKLGQRLI